MNDIPNYYKDYKPTEAQHQAVEETNRKRKVTCARQLEEYRLKKEAEKKQKSLLIPKTKKK